MVAHHRLDWILQAQVASPRQGFDPRLGKGSRRRRSQLRTPLAGSEATAACDKDTARDRPTVQGRMLAYINVMLTARRAGDLQNDRYPDLKLEHFAAFTARARPRPAPAHASADAAPAPRRRGDPDTQRMHHSSNAPAARRRSPIAAVISNADTAPPTGCRCPVDVLADGNRPPAAGSR